MASEPILERYFNEEIDIDKLVGEGSIYARIYIEVQGNDMEACQKALERTVFDSLAHEESAKLICVKFYEFEKEQVEDELKKEFFSGVVEVELLFRDFRWMVNVIMRYGPSAIEIIEPDSVSLNLDEMQSLIADVSEMSQTFSSHIVSLMKDEERKAMYSKMLAGKKGLL